MNSLVRFADDFHEMEDQGQSFEKERQGLQKSFPMNPQEMDGHMWISESEDNIPIPIDPIKQDDCELVIQVPNETVERAEDMWNSSSECSDKVIFLVLDLGECPGKSIMQSGGESSSRNSQPNKKQKRPSLKQTRTQMKAKNVQSVTAAEDNKQISKLQKQKKKENIQNSDDLSDEEFPSLDQMPRKQQGSNYTPSQLLKPLEQSGLQIEQSGLQINKYLSLSQTSKMFEESNASSTESERRMAEKLVFQSRKKNPKGKQSVKESKTGPMRTDRNVQKTLNTLLKNSIKKIQNLTPSQIKQYKSSISQKVCFILLLLMVESKNISSVCSIYRIEAQNKIKSIQAEISQITDKTCQYALHLGRVIKEIQYYYKVLAAFKDGDQNNALEALKIIFQRHQSQIIVQQKRFNSAVVRVYKAINAKGKRGRLADPSEKISYLNQRVNNMQQMSSQSIPFKVFDSTGMLWSKTN